MEAEPRLGHLLKRSISTGDLVTIKRLLKGGVDVSSRLWFGRTLLQEAVTIGRLAVVQLLLQNARPDINAQNQDGRTALHIASRAGRADIVKLLVEAGADLDVQCLAGVTSLHTAVWRNKIDVVNDLLDAGANVNLQDMDGWTPLHWAAKKNICDIAKLLIEKGANVNKLNKNSVSPFHQAIKHSDLTLARYLIYHGADVNSLLNVKQSVCSFMIQQKDLEPRTLKRFVTLMMDYGYDIRQDTSLHRILSCVVDEENSSVLSWLHAQQKSVGNLLDLCRFYVRRYLSHHYSCNDKIDKAIDTFPIPQTLVDFLKCSQANSLVKEAVLPFTQKAETKVKLEKLKQMPSLSNTGKLTISSQKSINQTIHVGSSSVPVKECINTGVLSTLQQTKDASAATMNKRDFDEKATPELVSVRKCAQYNVPVVRKLSRNFISDPTTSAKKCRCSSELACVCIPEKSGTTFTPKKRRLWKSSNI